MTNFRKAQNAAAVLEWVIAFIFSFYVFSFYVDLFPAVRTRHMGHGFKSSNPATRQAADVAMEEAGSDRHLTNPAGHGGQRLSSVDAGMNGYGNGTNGYANGTNGYHANGVRQPANNF